MSATPHSSIMSAPRSDSAIIAAFGKPIPRDEKEALAFAEANELGVRDLNPQGIRFITLIKEDFRTHGSDLFSQGFWAIAVHRFGNWRMNIRPRVLRAPFSILYKVLYKFVQWTCGISLDYATKVGRRVHLWHHSGMILSCRAIGDEVHIRHNTTFGIAHLGDPITHRPIIGDRVEIGVGAVIMGPITIGHDSVIGANAVVVEDVPPYSLAVGVPAKVVKSLAPLNLEAKA
jgi:serine O-acetyltransferase